MSARLENVSLNSNLENFSAGLDKEAYYLTRTSHTKTSNFR